MAYLNKVMIIGNLGKDPEMRYLPSGSALTSFSVACTRRSGGGSAAGGEGGESREETEWFNVTAFDKLAEICNQYLQKGKSVYVEGRMRTRSWTGQDGQKHYRTELIAERMQMLGSRTPGAGDADMGSSQSGGDPLPPASNDDEMPF